MAIFDEIRQARLDKLNTLKNKGLNPYPAKTQKEYELRDVIANFESLAQKELVTLAGRVMAIRGQGGLIFFNLNDGTATFQGLLKRDAMEAEVFDLFVNTVDVGDFVEISGKLFITQKGQKTLQVSAWAMLTKTLRPLPDKWDGLQDIEERFRKRYLDILMNPELKSIFEKKAKFWNATRNFLTKEGFLEVETPTLEVTTGGAEARPFKTHHNDFDLDVFLRISVGELWQKRLLAAGFSKVFEIGRVYRNEGSSPEHTQEFTNLEFYAGYMDYEQGISLTERLLKEVISQTFDTLEFTIRDQKVNFAGQWERISYVETVKKMLGIDVLTATESEMQSKLDTLGVKYEGNNRERLTDSLWKVCRKQIMGPVWLVDVPKLVSPLAKTKPENPLLTERVQLIVAGAEVTNGFSELNDPVDQASRFATQQELIARGDEEAMMSDDEFVEMLEYGMPPAFGFGMGGDRLFSFLVGKPLRETQLFPLMRPKKD